jgi:hypothetical protein
MPVDEGELAQLKAYVRAMMQLLEAIEARYKLPEEPGPEDTTPPARFDRMR